MPLDYPALAESFSRLLETHPSVTVLSHIHPDSDAIGTALGVYHWLKGQGIKVEVANATRELPHYLDFLPSFSKIKNRMEFSDSLIIACDSGSIDRLGFEVTGRTIVAIDHHTTNTHFGALNAVDPEAVASAQIAYRLLEAIAPVSPESATAFYAALISDTRNFTTNNVNADVFALAEELVRRGVPVAQVTRQMLHRRSLASLRILGAAIGSLELLHEARIAVMTVSQEDLARTGARSSDLDGIVDYARSLVTVEVAVMIVQRRKEIKISLRSKGADVARIAQHFGGGGHIVAAGFELQDVDLKTARDRVVQRIEEAKVLG